MQSTSGASDDPFEQFLKPPANETATDRRERLKREADAKAVNEAINAQLRKERAQTKKGTVKILLLGQAESGKSTTLKNFRLMFAKDSWDAERASWRAVIHLNIIRSVITIVNTLQAELDGNPLRRPDTPDDGRPSSPATTESHAHTIQPATTVFPSSLRGKHERLKVRLPALKGAFRELQARLGEGAHEEFEEEAPEPSSGPSKAAGEGRQSLSRSGARPEFCVRRLQEALASAEEASRSKTDAPTEVLLGSLGDILAVWNDDASKEILRKSSQIRESLLEPDSFLNDLTRIVQRTYVPTDNDVIRSRLRTVGVQEYRINVSGSSGSVGVNQGKDWLIYDVGGSRTMRQAWVPYFDDVQAIIFLAPISCFDERLAEDLRVNRLEDSFILWKQICSSRLLSNASLILFLNKCDLLGKKLKAGAKVEKYLPSFAGRSNDISTVVKYLREKFRVSSRDHSPITRPCYIYPTSVIDTAKTAETVKTVKDGILRDYLRSADLV